MRKIGVVGDVVIDHLAAKTDPIEKKSAWQKASDVG
jgi:hypothetical protein